MKHLVPLGFAASAVLAVGVLLPSGPSDAADSIAPLPPRVGPSAPLSKGKGKGQGFCDVHCPPCTTLVDLTPQRKYDCRFTCEPIPGCAER